MSSSTGKGTLAAQVRVARLVEALKKKGVTNDYCPRCNVFDWAVDFLDIPASSLKPILPFAPPPGSNPQLSVVAMECKNCGYLILHSLQALGISLE
jgi:hypothetical protein